MRWEINKVMIMVIDPAAIIATKLLKINSGSIKSAVLFMESREFSNTVVTLGIESV
jgi:hypothetical protein